MKRDAKNTDAGGVKFNRREFILSATSSAALLSVSPFVTAKPGVGAADQPNALQPDVSAKKTTVDIETVDIEKRYQYALALEQERLTSNLVLNDSVFAHWIEDSNHFWYEQETKDGRLYRLVDADKATSTVAFDHDALADVLSKALGRSVDAFNLPIAKVKVDLSPRKITFVADDKFWEFDDKKKTCHQVSVYPADWLISPDGNKAAFAREYNIWVKDLKSGSERALTTDGTEFYAYGDAPGAWGAQEALSLQGLWSPDSRRLFMLRRDCRYVKSLPVLDHTPSDGVRPVVRDCKVAYPGDEHIEEFALLAIDMASGKICKADYRQIPSSYNAHWGYFLGGLGWWGKDNRHAFFIDEERGSKRVSVVEFDTNTGACRPLFEETSKTRINLSQDTEDTTPSVALPESNELIWYSERSGWAHLYLYDLKTGKLKNAITQGKWVVRDLLHVDPERRELLIQTSGRVADRNPYYRDICKVNMDTGEFTPLFSGDLEYTVTTQKTAAVKLYVSVNQRASDSQLVTGISPNGRYVLATRSRADQVPVNLLLDRDGNEIMQLEVADVSGLPAGWQWPEPVTLKDADGKTEIYGTLFRPTGFSPDEHYPVVYAPYNVPYVTTASTGSFANNLNMGSSFYRASALAQLGFVVVTIDGRGTPFRSKAFQEESYGWIPSCTPPQDVVAGIRQLANRYTFMDMGRVGVFTSNSGATAVMDCLLQYPDLFKVGVVGRVQDSRFMGSMVWGDLFEGLSKKIDDQRYPEYQVEKLKGKLLLMHGLLEGGSNPPVGTFRIVEALSKANKNFDMILMPKAEYPLNSNYTLRRGWDYIVKHLAGVEPPKEFDMTRSV